MMISCLNSSEEVSIDNKCAIEQFSYELKTILENRNSESKKKGKNGSKL